MALQSRRAFLKATVAAGGGLLLGFHLPMTGSLLQAAEPANEPFEPNAWMRITPDNQVTIMVAHSEMGQGVMTALPMLVADELDVDLNRVRIVTAPAAPAYINPMIGAQLTGGSTSVRSSWNQLRQAGATARAMLVSVAAARWGVAADTLVTHDGVVREAKGKRTATYGELAGAARKIPVPPDVTLKAPSQYELIGKPTARVDIPAKVNGTARFGIDMRVPGMLIAVVARCPTFGGKLRNFNADKAKEVKGVRHVLAISSGVAVVADSFWPAKSARDLLHIDWDHGPNANLSDDLIAHRFEKGAEHQGAVASSRGNADHVMAGAAKRLEAVYTLPYLAHAAMEPINCTAYVRQNACDVWAPTQAQTFTQQRAAQITGLPASRVDVHTTFLGGGFGRRGETDFVADAVEISKALKVPIKVMWTREDDTRHDFYRPAVYSRLRAGLDANGELLAWTNRIVAPSILSRVNPARVHNGIDPTSVEGAADLPYAIPNIRVDYVMDNVGVPVGFWRSVGNSFTGFIVESFIDETAHAAGADPYEFRRKLLRKSPRHLQVLTLAAERAGWGKPLPHGTYRGIALVYSYGSYVAQVAEVSVVSGQPQVHRVVCVVDCGHFVNPDTIEAQMQSGIVYGLTAALMSKITLKHGRVRESNFDDYPVLRINQMPRVEVHIVPSNEPPGGIGEPGTPPIAPAVCNALFAATGKRIRNLPISL
ncbi:MAG: molybdopterin cofactor-binding domain-containing protein [Candidatus Binataceae bacterium]